MWMLLLCALADTTGEPQVSVAPAESLSVTVAGQGAPVVLIPGLFGSAFGYRTLVPSLTAAGYQAIVIEPLGIGASARPARADYSLAAQAIRVARALDVLGVQGAIVVAHAVGAAIAYRLAYLRPDLVRAVLSLEGGPAEAAATPGFRRAMKFAPWIKLFGGVRRVRSQIHHYLVAASRDTGWVTEATVAGYTAGAARDLDATLKAYLAMAAAREPEALRPHLGAIQCPVLLMVGAWPHAAGPPPREVALLAAALPSFAVDSVPDVGHFVYEERPDAVVAAVERIAAATAVQDRRGADGGPTP